MTTSGRHSMAPKKTLNAKNLETLGASRLAELLMQISTGSAAHKRRLRLELAGSQGGVEVAREFRKRLVSIARARTFINWRKVKALKKDLETQRMTIVDTLAPEDPMEAFELIGQSVQGKRFNNGSADSNPEHRRSLACRPRYK